MQLKHLIPIIMPFIGFLLTKAAENVKNLLHPIGETSDYEFSEEELEDCADTDEDSLLDFEEIMFFTKRIFLKKQLIKFDGNTVKLPSVNEMINLYTDELSYVRNGLEIAQNNYGEYYRIFLGKPVLPIYSDPTSEDGDGDEIKDIDDNMPLVYMTKDGLIIYEFLNSADYYEIEFYFSNLCILIPNNVQRVRFIEICRKYINTDTPDLFCNELVNEGIIDRLPSSSIYNDWTTALGDYELRSDGTSFQEISDKMSNIWHQDVNIFFSIYALGITDKYCQQMAEYDYSPAYKESLKQEQTRIIENYEKVLEEYKINYRYNNINDLDDFKSRIPKNATEIPWKYVKGGASKGVKYKWTDESGNVWQARAHSADPSAPVGSNASKGWIYRVQVKFGGKGRWFFLDQYGNFHIDKIIDNPRSIYYSEYYANATHIPLYGMWEN